VRSFILDGSPWDGEDDDGAEAPEISGEACPPGPGAGGAVYAAATDMVGTASGDAAPREAVGGLHSVAPFSPSLTEAALRFRETPVPVRPVADGSAFRYSPTADTAASNPIPPTTTIHCRFRVKEPGFDHLKLEAPRVAYRSLLFLRKASLSRLMTDFLKLPPVGRIRPAPAAASHAPRAPWLQWLAGALP
jgi:hypothetical protein